MIPNQSSLLFLFSHWTKMLKVPLKILQSQNSKFRQRHAHQSTIRQLSENFRALELMVLAGKLIRGKQGSNFNTGSQSEAAPGFSAGGGTGGGRGVSGGNLYEDFMLTGGGSLKLGGFKPPCPPLWSQYYSIIGRVKTPLLELLHA